MAFLILTFGSYTEVLSKRKRGLKAPFFIPLPFIKKLIMTKLKLNFNLVIFMFKRDVDTEIQGFASNYPIVTVIGPR